MSVMKAIIHSPYPLRILPTYSSFYVTIRHGTNSAELGQDCAWSSQELTVCLTVWLRLLKVLFRYSWQMPHIHIFSQILSNSKSYITFATDTASLDTKGDITLWWSF
jgi:hypothetical protein